MKRHLLVALSAVCIAFTAVAEKHEYLTDSIPERWQSDDGMLTQTFPSEDQWWDCWPDSTLHRLIRQGVEANYNLRMALKRIEVARLAVKQTRSGYFPTLNANASWQKERQAGRVSGKNVPSSDASSWSLGLDASWEVDIFGRIASQAKAKEASWRASREEYLGMMNSVATNIAKTYIDLRMNQAVKELLEQHIKSQEAIVKITEVRRQTGISSDLDVAQSKTVLYSTMANLPSVEASIITDINSLSTLLGTYPESLGTSLATPQPLPDFTGSIALGIPSQLLTRRPDIAEAYANVEVAMAQTGVAKKEWLPTLGVEAMVATESRDISGLFGARSLSWSVTPTLSWTIFDGLSRDYAIQEAKLQAEAEVDNYNQTLLTAVQEVNNAIAQYDASRQDMTLLQDVITEATKSFDLSLDLYKKGLNPFTDVMNAQETLLEYQSRLVSAKADMLIAIVELYQALGGGW